jgi:hypothetical protein
LQEILKEGNLIFLMLKGFALLLVKQGKPFLIGFNLILLIRPLLILLLEVGLLALRRYLEEPKKSV